MGSSQSAAGGGRPARAVHSHAQRRRKSLRKQRRRKSLRKPISNLLALGAMNSLRPMLISSVLLAAAQGVCRRDSEVCTAIRSCAPALLQLQQAKAAVDATEKARIIGDLRTKVCGLKSDRTVCCEDGQGSTPGKSKATSAAIGKRKIGSFVNIWHGIAGEVFALDDETILIEDFTYDGEGPDAFFLAGTTGRPSKNGQVVLPFPDEEKTFGYTDKDIPILGRFTGDQDIVLKMPPGRKVSDLKWVSVWCRDFVVDFGHANIDA